MGQRDLIATEEQFLKGLLVWNFKGKKKFAFLKLFCP